MALGTFLHHLRPRSLHEQRGDQRLYHAHAQHVAGRVRAIFDDWLARREIEPDNGRLANTAAVNRWELLRLAREVEALEPPRSMVSVHGQVYTAVINAARACQLLANGYRFHKSGAVCDGQALLLDTVNEIDDLLVQLQI